MLPATDQQLVQIVDAASADAARRSGKWLLCKPGCTQCCVGVFAISQLDALRLREGLAELKLTDPARAESVQQRVNETLKRLSPDFPGNPVTGILNETAQAEFEAFANNELCPVLDPSTGCCDLYAARPMTCRIFGPPLRNEEGIGVCELCFVGATEAEIATGELHLECDELEAALTAEAEGSSGISGNTIVAFAFNSRP
jgi:Fe-S-cluster containining protein